MTTPSNVIYALRTFLRNPAFTAAAVLTLALGIGANTAIFSVVHGILLRPLPYPGAERIYMAWNNNTREGIERDVTSYPNFTDWRERGEVWDGLAAVSSGLASLIDGGDPEQVRAAWVTQDFLRVFRVTPALGRDFTDEEMRAGSDQVVLLSDAVWQRRFGGDPAIVGRDIQISGRQYTVIGVMPPGFAMPADTELWGPLAPQPDLAESRGSLWLSVVGRLRSGVSPELAQQRMDDVATQLAADFPGPNTGAGIMLEPLHSTIVGDVRTPLLVLLGAVAVVLLIGCANVANLLLARGAVRRKELAIRAALGAGRRRVAAQLLTESVVLSLIGGLVGALFAIWAVGFIVSMAPAELPRVGDVRVDGTVLGFTTAISVVAGLLFGLAPLLQAGRADLMHTLRDGGRDAVGGEGVGRIRPVLVGGEVALALVLLVAAGLLIRSFLALHAVDPGFDTRNALTFRVGVPTARYDSPDRVRQFHGELLQRLETTPGVQSAGAVSALFLSRLPNMSPIIVEGGEIPADDAQRESVVIDGATPGFFTAFGMRLVQGRTFDATDHAQSTPVAIVNETFVRRYFPDVDPIGRRFTFGDPSNPNVVWLEIAGVVADARRSGLAVPVRPESYRPYAQRSTNTLTYVLRANVDAASLVPAVRAAVRDIDPLLPISAISTIEQSLAEQLAARRFIMVLLGAFAALALLLASIGIYGVVAYLVAQRTREMGIRMALGASRADVLGLIVRQSLRNIVPGIVVGGAAAFLLTRLLRSQLFGVSPGDPLTFAAVALTLLGVGMLASYVPALRAARVHPQVALRQE